jgi:transposase
MRRVYQKSGVIASGREVFVGIDVHKKSFHVTAVCEGEEVFHGGMPSKYEVVKKLLDRFENCRVRVAYEAGPCGFWLHDRLMADGIETIVVPPSLIPVESGNRVKTDRRDSRKLAVLFESGMLKKVHVLTEKERSDGSVMRRTTYNFHFLFNLYSTRTEQESQSEIVISRAEFLPLS